MQTMMTADGNYTPSFAAALTAATAVIGPIIPPSIPMVVYALVSDASIGYLFLGGVVPGLLMGAGADGDHRADRPAPELPGRRPDPAPRAPRHHRPRLPGADDAGGAARLHLQRRHHPDRGGGHRRRLRLPDLGAPLPRASRCASTYASLLSSARTTASIGMLIAGAHGLQLRRHRREHPARAQRRPAGPRPLAARLPDPRQPPPARPRLPARRHDDPPRSSCRSSSRPPRRSASTWSTSASSSSSTS